MPAPRAIIARCKAQMMCILEQAAAQAPPPSDLYRTAVFVQRGTKSIEQIAEEARRRFPEPQQRGPRSVDLIRPDRDSR